MVFDYRITDGYFSICAARLRDQQCLQQQIVALQLCEVLK